MCEQENTLTHAHGHAHDHAVQNVSGEATSPEETFALLSYMVHHNHHHAEELSALSKNLRGEAAESLQKAIRYFESGNAELRRALELMKEESC